MARILPTLERMIKDGIVPVNRGGVWIDIYNKSINCEKAGTIHTRISNGNYWYVTTLEDTAGNEPGIH